jgi:MFS family permease
MYRAAAWGGAFITIGLFPNRIAAPVLVGVAGVGRPLIDVAGRTLLQRVVPDRVLSRVFGVLEGLYAAGLALGLAVIPALFALIGVRATFVISGAFLPLLFLCSSVVACPRSMQRAPFRKPRSRCCAACRSSCRSLLQP